jgi:hypothetical protein
LRILEKLVTESLLNCKEPPAGTLLKSKNLEPLLVKQVTVKMPLAGALKKKKPVTKAQKVNNFPT